MSFTAAMGWMAAGVMTAMWVLGRRALDSRMEAVTRVCHELRGPLTAAQLGLELGSRSLTLSADQMRAIHSELGRATVALDDLAAARQNRRAPERLDLAVLLAESVAAWRPVANRAGVGIDLQVAADLPRVDGDRRRLCQATGNLIANAIEHAGRSVCVRASWRSERIRIDVIDDGPGLPAPVAELARHARRGRGLHGRGLAIATAAATAHGGRVTAEPASRGAHLVLELPTAT